MVNTLNSLVRWTAGVLFILPVFAFLMIHLSLGSRETTFHRARALFAVMNRIMGIRLEVRGARHIDPDQTYLILGNHQSLFDLFVIPAAIPLIFTGVEAAYHFKLPIWGYVIRRWGCIPIERENLEKARQSLEIARQTLEGGLSIAILPEGHRTRTGQLGPFKKGPFHLALASKATILPFGIKGLYDFQQRGGFHITPGRVIVSIGRPIPYAQYAHLCVDALRDKIHDQVRELTR